MQPKVKESLHNIMLAEDRKTAYKAFDDTVTLYEAKYPKAMKCLLKDKDTMLAFYDLQPSIGDIFAQPTQPNRIDVINRSFTNKKNTKLRESREYIFDGAKFIDSVKQVEESSRNVACG